jgi:serine/threonine-protein kinase
MTPSPEATGILFDRLAHLAVGPTANVELCRVVSGEHQESLVAVKRLRPMLADDPEFIAMFRDEMWMAAALRHPNIAQVLGWGEDEQGLYLAVEFVRGVSLQRLMRTVFVTGEAFTERLVVYLASCVCSGLSAAHELRSQSGELLNLVHRDLTPGNLLLGFDGEVKITDFGLAKAKQRITHTAVGITKGEPAYMSPEQVRGKPLDGRSDLFALGVVRARSRDVRVVLATPTLAGEQRARCPRAHRARRCARSGRARATRRSGAGAVGAQMLVQGARGALPERRRAGVGALGVAPLARL